MKRILFVLLISISASSNALPFSSFYFLELPLQCYFTQDNIYFSSYWDNKLIKTDYDGNVFWSKIVAALPQEFRDNYYYGYAYKTDSVILFKCDTAANVIWAKDISSTVCPRIGNDLNRIMGVTVNQDRIFISTIQFTSVGMIDGNSGMITLDTSGHFITSWCDFTSGIGIGLSHYDLNGYPSISGAWIRHRVLGSTANESLIRVNHDGYLDSGFYSVDFISAPGNVIENVEQLLDSTFVGFSRGWDMYSGNICLSRFDESANILWKNVITGIDTSYLLNGGTCDSSGNIYIFSSTVDDISSLPGPLVFIKMDLNGNLISSKGFDPMVPFVAAQMHYRNGYLYLFGDYQLGNQFYKGILATDTTFHPCNLMDFSFTAPITPGQVFSGIQFPIPAVPYTFGNYLSAGNNIDTTVLIADLCSALSSTATNDPNRTLIYPNPVLDKIFIEGIVREKTLLRIYNLVGEEIYESEINNNSEIDLSDFLPGVYQFEFFSEKSHLVKRVIKL